MSLNGGSSRDSFTVGDRAHLNRVVAQLDRGAPGSQHTPDPQQLRLTVFQAAHGFAAGDPVCYNATGAAAWKKALATDTADSKLPLGVVEYAATNAFTVVLTGMIRGLTSLTAGTLYYLANAGGLTATAPSRAIPMLAALSATTGVVLRAVAPSSRIVPLGANQSTGTSVSVSSLTGQITKEFAVNVSAWARSTTLSYYGERLSGRVIVRWNGSGWVYQSNGLASQLFDSDCLASGGASPTIGPTSVNFLAATVSFAGGAAGDYTTISSVTVTLALNPNQNKYGCALSIEGVQP